MTMTERVHPTDLELAALISSKVCHDLVNPVGATNNGFEVLDSESDPNAKAYALDVIRSASRQASARLEFARFAFGAAGGAGTLIELGKVRRSPAASLSKATSTSSSGTPVPRSWPRTR
jgi:histidine phosphotransferase ChpT